MPSSSRAVFTLQQASFDRLSVTVFAERRRAQKRRVRAPIGNTCRPLPATGAAAVVLYDGEQSSTYAEAIPRHG